MDGTLTVADLIVEHLEGTGDLDAGAVTDLVTFLRGEGFLEPQTVDAVGVLADALRPRPSLTDRVMTFVKTLKLDWEGADRHVRWWYRPSSARCSPGPGVSSLPSRARRLRRLPRRELARAVLDRRRQRAARLPDPACPRFVLTYSHELGHALALVHFDRRIRNAGFMFYFGSPAFFVDASDGLMLERGPRILESALGPYTEMILAGIATILLLASPTHPSPPCCTNSGAQLLPDLREPDPALGARRVLHPGGGDRGPRPSRALAAVHPTRRLAQVPGASRTIQAGDRTRRIRDRRGRVHDLLGLGRVFFWEAIFGEPGRPALWNGGTGITPLLLLLAAFVTGPAVRG